MQMPPAPLQVAVTAAAEAYEAVLGDVGADARMDCVGQWGANGDAVDARLLADAHQGRSQRSGGQMREAFTPPRAQVRVLLPAAEGRRDAEITDALFYPGYSAETAASVSHTCSAVTHEASSLHE